VPQEQEEALEAVEAVLLAEQAPVPVESLLLAVLQVSCTAYRTVLNVVQQWTAC